MITKETYNEDNGLHYTKHGEGPPVILVHGFAASNFDWVYLEPELVENGYQVFSPDLIGHGSSIRSTPKIGYTFQDIYRHFSDWINSQGFSQEITLIGHSLGGLICLNFAIQNPTLVRNLILINPYYTKKQLNRFLKYVSGNPGPYRKALQITPSWLIHVIVSLDIRGYVHYEDQTRKQKAQDVSRAAPEIVYIPGSIPHFSDHLPEIQSPACVIWGTKDTTLNPKSFPELANQLPNAASVPIHGTGHQPHLSQFRQLNRIVLEFLENQTTA
jgi:pimeloyl-ACP methyl ester carboxylesterase